MSYKTKDTIYTLHKKKLLSISDCETSISLLNRELCILEEEIKNYNY